MAITRPITKTQISTTAWGIPITDEVNRLSPLVDANKWDAFVPLTLLNGFVAESFAPPPRISRNAGAKMAYIYGSCVPPAASNNVFTVVAPYLPLTAMRMTVGAYAAGGSPRAARGDFFANGSMSVAFDAGALMVWFDFLYPTL